MQKSKELYNSMASAPSLGANNGPVYLDDVTGVLGEWLNRDLSDIPQEARYHLTKAYNICCSSFS